jgi:putative transposase
VRVKYTYKLRLYPTAEQRVLLAKHFGCTRYLYNYFLARRKQEYLTTGRSNNFVRDCKELTTLKKTITWLTEVGSQSLQQAIKNLDAAYGNFFEKRAKFPKFKSKHDKQSFRVPQNIKLVDGKLVMPKFLEGIKCVVHQPVEEEISFCTITKNKAGQYHCTLMVEKEIEQHKPVKKEVGIDLGIKTLVVDSDGQEYENIKPYRTLRKKLKRVQRKLSKRRHKSTNKESMRIEKLRVKLARVHQKVKDVRQNHLHQTTKKLIDENQVIYLETLAVKNMMKNHCLAGAIADCGWYELTRQLEYKAAWYGRTVVKIDRYFPSSKTCNHCFHIKQDLKLSDREWTCVCGTKHDRDKNAAKMIFTQGKKQTTVGTTGSKARRLRSKPAELSVG